MNSKDFSQLLTDLAQAWADRNYERAAYFFADDIKYADPTRYKISNRAELFKFFQDDGGLPQITVWHNILFDEARQMAAVEYSYRGHHLYHGFVLVKLKDDKIWRWREYQHISQLPWEEHIGDTAF